MDEPLLLTYCTRCGARVSPYKPSGLSLRPSYEYGEVPPEDLLSREPHYWCGSCLEHWLATNLQDTGVMCPCGMLVPGHHRYCGACGRSSRSLPGDAPDTVI